MSEKSRFQLGELVANRYQLVEQVNENDDYVNYICQYDGWNFFAKIYFGGIKVDENKFDIIKNLGSTNICRVIDSGIYKNRFCIVRPFFNNGNIMQIAPVHYEYLLKQFIPTVNEALHEIHEAGIIHGKITPSNIFYSDFGNDIVLGEFGISLCKECEEEGAFYSESQYIEFLPPEAVNGIVTKEADYYALGITLYCLITGVKPYLNMEKTEVLKAIYTEELPIPDSVNPIIAKFIKGLTVKAKDDRWGYEEIKRALDGEDVEINDSFVCDMSFFEEDFEEDFNDDLAEPLDSSSLDDLSENALNTDISAIEKNENSNNDEEIHFLSYLENENNKKLDEDIKIADTLNIKKATEATKEDHPNLEDTIVYNFKGLDLSKEEEEKLGEAAKYAVKGILNDFEAISEEKASFDESEENKENTSDDDDLLSNSLFDDFIINDEVEIKTDDFLSEEFKLKEAEENAEIDDLSLDSTYLSLNEAYDEIKQEEEIKEIEEKAEEENKIDAPKSYASINAELAKEKADKQEKVLSYYDKIKLNQEKATEEKSKTENSLNEGNENITLSTNNAPVNPFKAKSTVAENPFKEAKKVEEKVVPAKPNNSVPIEELISKKISDNGIKFLNETYYDAKALAMALTKNWEAAKDLLYDGKIHSYFKYKDEAIDYLAKACIEHEDKDLGLFRFIYEVYPNQELCYKGVTFYDLTDISEGILLSDHTNLYREMLINGILSFYLIKNTQYAKAEKIIPLEDMARDGIKNIDLIICIMLYTLSDDPVFIFDDKAFRTVDELVDYLNKNDSMIDSICSRLMGDTTFYGWIEFLGYSDVLSQFI